MSIRILAAPLSFQFPASGLGKWWRVGEALGPWTHPCEKCRKSPGSWLQVGWTVAAYAFWGVNQCVDVLSLLYFGNLICLSNKMNK